MYSSLKKTCQRYRILHGQALIRKRFRPKLFFIQSFFIVFVSFVENFHFFVKVHVFHLDMYWEYHQRKSFLWLLQVVYFPFLFDI